MTEKIGEKVYIAAEFLIKQLSGGEKSSNEVLEKASEEGIPKRTLERARRIAGVKSRKSEKKWYMSITENAGEKFSRYVIPVSIRNWANEQLKQSYSGGTISSDWLTVCVKHESASHPPQSEPSARLYIKAGGYEFTASSEFPMEKLAELLRGLGVEGKC